MTESVLVLFLAKLLPVFAYPLGLTLWLLASGALLYRLCFPRLARLCLCGGVTVLWVCSTPVVADWAAFSLERQYPERKIGETPEADVVIVLGGFVGQPTPPRTRPDLSDGADRGLHAARLYRAGKAKRILVSGGNLPWEAVARPEAELIRELLVEWGVPAEAIEIATESRNTYENALEIGRLWKGRPFTSALLVTSAVHMPRAMATFRRAGLPVIAATTDVHVVYNDHLDPVAWLPQAGALAMTTSAVKEWIGFLVYRARGYL